MENHIINNQFNNDNNLNQKRCKNEIILLRTKNKLLEKINEIKRNNPNKGISEIKNEIRKSELYNKSEYDKKHIDYLLELYEIEEYNNHEKKLKKLDKRIEKQLKKESENNKMTQNNNQRFNNSNDDSSSFDYNNPTPENNQPDSWKMISSESDIENNH
ncbi:MAG: hypothetical protein N4A49_04830 [Marinifilaceae bacterium]|jgi:hypothetical protein|nr:hypothetical protein [Marinifilaceae bacterium]